MAFWGAPLANQEHAVFACRAALRCQAKVAELNAGWREQGKPIFTTRIGLNTGTAIVGNLGSSERMNYSVMGDTVNLANRLEGVNKSYGTAIIISQSTYEKVWDELFTRPLDIVRVRGKQIAVPIYELLAEKGEKQEELAWLCARFHDGFDRYRKREWAQALSLFQSIKEVHPDDAMTEEYLNRCREFMEQPPGADWDGVWESKRKGNSIEAKQP